MHGCTQLTAGVHLENILEFIVAMTFTPSSCKTGHFPPYPASSCTANSDQHTSPTPQLTHMLTVHLSLKQEVTGLHTSMNLAVMQDIGLEGDRRTRSSNLAVDLCTLFQLHYS